MSALWSDLTAAALTGTGRNPSAGSLPGALAELLTDTPESETRLLRAAGVLDVAERAAGIAEPSALPAPEPAPPEEHPPVSDPESVRLVTRMFDENVPPPLLFEACALLAGSRQTLPPRLLPRALELGRQSVTSREPLRPALGRRGAWLAAQNPDWKFALTAGTEEADPKIWDEGDASQRSAFLRRLRSDDPAAARELLEQVFPSESARDRAVLLPALERNLSLEDEPFLSSILANDRSREVRALVPPLLIRLPESAFAKRMAVRLDACVRITKKLVRTTVSIDAPETFSDDWKADLLEEKPPAYSKIGERAWWLQQLTRFSPAGWWENKLNATPAEVLKIAAKSDWKDALFTGFSHAPALRSGAAAMAWIPTLAESGVLQKNESLTLLLTLPPVEADAALRKFLNTPDDVFFAAHIIQSADFPWSEELWRTVRTKLPIWLGKRDWQLRGVLPVLACRIPPPLLNGEIAPPDIDFFDEAWAEFLRLLELRRQLYKLFPPAP